jgi:protein gp37
LTKSPERYNNYGWTLDNCPNFWFGTTVTTDRDLAALVHKESSVMLRFLSIEPLLGPVYAKSYLKKRFAEYVEWVIIGAITGSGAKKYQPRREWIDDICAQADEAGIPVFMKDSLAGIVGAENMRRELPWEAHI